MRELYILASVMTDAVARITYLTWADGDVCYLRHDDAAALTPEWREVLDTIATVGHPVPYA